VLAPAIIGRAFAATGGAPLPIPDVLDLRGGGGAPALDAMAARSRILEGRDTGTVGYGQGFLGPVIRVNRHETARLNLGNKIKEPVSVHWHGIHIEGSQDGTAELLVQVDRKADAAHLFMFHCHILEHEDLGMMGQFSVT